MEKRKGLKKGQGFTTGTCAAAATKAATITLISGKKPKEVEIHLPINKSLTLPVFKYRSGNNWVSASIIKVAGDDPDVTNGAEIVARVRIENKEGSSLLTVFGGKGVGVVTKPGLAVPIGQPAINPVPLKMIEDAVRDVIKGYGVQGVSCEVIISVKDGEEIAKRTVNERLGIIGGISILGTTGIVEPISTPAWRDTISCSLDVALASGLKEVVFSTGRSSEKTAEEALNLPEEAFILVGDHMGYALQQADERSKVKGERGTGVDPVCLKKVTIAGKFGKLLKMASGHFDTHIKDSTIDIKVLSEMVLEKSGRRDVARAIEEANTAREAFFIIQNSGLKGVFHSLCQRVCENARSFVGDSLTTGCMLVSYDGTVVEMV